MNLDTGFDSKTNRKAVWNAGLKPNIPENIRNRDARKPKKGRPRHFWIKSYKSRFTGSYAIVVEEMSKISYDENWELIHRSHFLLYDNRPSRP